MLKQIKRAPPLSYHLSFMLRLANGVQKYVHSTLSDALDTVLLHPFCFSFSLIKPKVCCHNQLDAEHLKSYPSSMIFLALTPLRATKSYPLNLLAFFCKLSLMGACQYHARKLKSTRMIDTFVVRTLIN
jgi:hypothetical protein